MALGGEYQCFVLQVVAATEVGGRWMADSLGRVRGCAGGKNELCLLQLATEHGHAFLFDLYEVAHLPAYYQFLEQLLMSETIAKLGTLGDSCLRAEEECVWCICMFVCMCAFLRSHQSC